MSQLEPPTVLIRVPPSRSPAPPPSPAPTRNTPEGSSSRCLSPEQETIRSGSSTPETPTALYVPGPGDDGSRKKRKKKRGSLTMKGSSLQQTLTDWRLLLHLENSGSVARDHLASERTFLAYARTSLTIASTGVALVQLFTLSATTMHQDLEKYARPLGAVMIALGLFTLCVGVARYFLVQEALIRGVYPVARITPTLLSFVLFSVVIAVFAIILVIKSNT